MVDSSSERRWTVEDYDPEKDAPPEHHHDQGEDPPNLPPLEEEENG